MQNSVVFQDKTPALSPVLPSPSRRPSVSHSDTLEYKGVQNKYENLGEDRIEEGEEEEGEGEEEESEGGRTKKYTRGGPDAWPYTLQKDIMGTSDMTGQKEGSEMKDGEGSSVSSSESRSTAVSASSAGALARHSNYTMRRNIIKFFL